MDGKKLRNKLKLSKNQLKRRRIKNKMAEIHLLSGIGTPYGYKYYGYFTSDMGDYLIYSRDGKRYYLDGTINSELLAMPDTPFKNVTSAKLYLTKRIKLKDKFGVKIKK